MNHSIYCFDRAAHLKMVVLALLLATAVAGLSLLLHSNLIMPTGKTAVLKAGKPVATASSSIVIIR